MNSRQAAALQVEPNPLQRALDNYQELEHQWHETTLANDTLRAENAALLSEVGMLRDLLLSADTDRVRWQATASTLLGRLYAINDVVGGAVKAAIRDGLEATVPKDREDDLEQAGAEVAEILQRLEPAVAPEAPPQPEAAPAPSQEVLEPATPGGSPTIPMVDFGPPRAEYRR